MSVIVRERVGVLTEEQCAHLRSAYLDKLKPSSVSYGENRVVSTYRVSDSYKIPRDDLRHDIQTILRGEVENSTGISGEQLERRLERWELLRYKVGGYFKLHSDWVPSSRHHQSAYTNGGQRLYSVVVYLSTVERGGETFFPELEKTVKPVMGTLVLWNNTSNGSILQSARHESKPVLEGEKWALVNWVRAREHLVP